AESLRASDSPAAGLARAEAIWGRVPPDDAPVRRRAGLLLLDQRYRAGAWVDFVELALELLPQLRAEGPRSELIDLLRQLSIAASDTGRYEVALTAGQEAHRIAVEIDDVGRISLATNALGCAFERTGDPWQGERLLVEALAIARTQDQPHPLFVALNNLVAVRIGQFYLRRDAQALEEARAPLREALPLALEALAQARASGESFRTLVALGNVGEVLVGLGDIGAAAPALDEAEALARGGYAAHLTRVGCSQAELALARGDAAAAWERLLGLIEGAGNEHLNTRLRLRHALWRTASTLDRAADALAHLQAYLQLERQRSMTQMRAQSELFVTRVEAEQMRLEARRHHARARELEADTRRDELTGLGNRREVELRWPQLVEQALKGSGVLAVAMIDLDHFKRVNDTHGHGVGDRVLVAMAALLRAHTRAADLVARLGGEEFLLVLPDADTERAREVCERLRVAVQGHDWEALAPGLRVTLSAGLTSGPPAEADRLTRRADTALYQAKSQGRNRVVPI
ncbi:MAG: GGDEF domain-containing protein, partial [Burkholderiales bacterium]|nr:GGDEF domain-containing protein [Burkholderiales bacterium]